MGEPAKGDKCPIWGTSAIILPTTRDGRNVDSPRAGGRYFITRTAEATLRNWDDQLRAHLTTWLVDQRRLGAECPEIMSNTLDKVARQRPRSVHERADRLLMFINNQTSNIGKPFCFSLRYLNKELQSWLESETFAHMKAWSESTEADPVQTPENDEVIYLINFLAKKAFIEEKVAERGANSQGPHQDTENYFEYAITPDGYAHIYELEKKSVDSKQAFVAIWFDDSMKDACDKGVEPAVREAGYEPLRIDQKEHINKVDDEIIAEIRRSRFLVADFTHGDKGPRGSVYYEAGFAHGLNIPVIFTCRQDVIKEIHFDTRQFNHIVWETPEDLRRQLANRIGAVIGDGPLKQ